MPFFNENLGQINIRLNYFSLSIKTLTNSMENSMLLLKITHFPLIRFLFVNTKIIVTKLLIIIGIFLSIEAGGETSTTRYYTLEINLPRHFS